MINKITLIIERNLSNKKLISEDLEYHILNDVGVDKNVFRPGSQKFFDLFAEARKLNKKGLYKLNSNEKYYINETDIGEWGVYEGNSVPLDYPIVEGEEDEIAEISERAKRKKKKKSGNMYQGKKVELNKPKRGGSKKYYVYVKDPETGNIKKVSFGAKGMSVGLNDPKRVKSFVARHRCKTHANDKTKASYWSCRLPRYFGNSGKKWW